MGAVLGPFRLAPGRHEIAFADADGSVNAVSRLNVKAGTSRDVVVHRPAEEGGTPVVSSFDTSMAPIAAGKGRVLLAHTATVAPADVRVNGQVVFTNIANGEYAEAELPAGEHAVALLPTGQDSPPILGPLDVTLEGLSVRGVEARTQAIAGVDVLSLACTPAAARAAVPEPCGESVADGWEVRLTGADHDDRGMAQVDLG